MSALERALEKQRLQLQSAVLRADLADSLRTLSPLGDGIDQAAAGVRWIARHPATVGGGVAFLAALRPGVRRFIWRWSRRSFIVWQLWRERSVWLRPVPAEHR